MGRMDGVKSYIKGLNLVEQTSYQPRKSRKYKSEIYEWVKALFFAVILALLIRAFVFVPFVVDGSSMVPTLEDTNRLIVNKLIYRINSPGPGDVIVFHATKEQDYIKRIIATAGQTVAVRGDKLYINGRIKDEPYLRASKEQAKADGFVLTEDFGPVRVPEGTVFVMGDNRRNSTDSRVIGPVRVDSIVGKAEVIVWPFHKFRMIH
ncbi:signal peptidase I [Aneurinibacillus sp. Ricciae_BoGa-3]|uniref:signal peptidase I n=1 Tax=Aneurinibacillus sp. Ricciae_BoGa-3 TaxID=3022697 RepID=UPI0023413DE6|nr:signal peptidase I [Aneurinibacillus sp. Ricciae_BoGa-3]WCK53001.1 signal peptidase I [Aneurinibacillus sp. Ricciae_BoGa-3]